MDKVAMEEDIHEIGEEEKEKLNDLDWESTAYRYSLICRACLCSAVIQIPREGYSWNCKKKERVSLFLIFSRHWGAIVAAIFVWLGGFGVNLASGFVLPLQFGFYACSAFNS
jgi:hypothetical protein